MGFVIMADKHTYNLTMAFGIGNNIATIVCYHDEEINSGLVRMIANSYAQIAIAQSKNQLVLPETFVNIVNAGLLNDYPNLKTVIVKSDVVMVISGMPKQNPLPNLNPDCSG